MLLRFLYRAYKARYRDQSAEILTSLRFIRSGDTVVDAGANKGSYLYWLRRQVGPTGCVLAFEPQPALATYLAEICRRLRWNNVQVHACALSDKAGTATLHVPGADGSPGASLVKIAQESKSTRSYDCPLATLDGIMSRGESLDFLKVDVEGHELEVFRGAKGTIMRNKPRILFECEDRHLQGRPMAEVFDYLLRLGYQGRFFLDGKLLSLEEFRGDVHQAKNGPRFWDEPDYCNNFFFEPL